MKRELPPMDPIRLAIAEFKGYTRIERRWRNQVWTGVILYDPEDPGKGFSVEEIPNWFADINHAFNLAEEAKISLTPVILDYGKTVWEARPLDFQEAYRDARPSKAITMAYYQWMLVQDKERILQKFRGL